jgi:uncharacterized protein
VAAGGLGRFVVGTAELRRTPGHIREARVEGPLPGVALSDSWVPDGAEVVADLRLEVLADGHLTASGTVRAPWEGRCRRCLRAVGGTLEVEVSEVFEPDPEVDAETYPLGVDRVDLEPMLRDAILLALPLAPLCRDDCAGPDPEANPVGGAADDEPALDPRWAGLSELRFEGDPAPGDER